MKLSHVNVKNFEVLDNAKHTARANKKSKATRMRAVKKKQVRKQVEKARYGKEYGL
jgi:hypothetical protein